MIIKPLNPRDARVLVVDDSSNDQRIIGRALETYGIRNRKVASTAEECLRDIERRKYDIALVDYYLPGMNGLELLKKHQRTLARYGSNPHHGRPPGVRSPSLR